MVWKLQCRAVSGCCSVWPYAYDTSSDVNIAVPFSCVLIIYANCSIKFSRFGIRYFFLLDGIAFLSDLESEAILTPSSFFTVITTACIRTSSLNFSARIMCPTFNNLPILLSTVSCSYKCALRPFPSVELFLHFS